jgi:xanthine dehydrogenase accessory factor
MQFFERVTELENERVPFAVAIVVSRRSPVSSHVGDRAIVRADGAMEGFVGGSCSRDIVRRQALDAIRSGTPRLVHIRPGASPPDTAAGGEETFVTMNCSSEGAADVYIEPHLPARRLIVAGWTPIARALARLAAALGYSVVSVAGEDENEDGVPSQALRIEDVRTFVGALPPPERERTIGIVASLGHYDEEALAALLAVPIGFVGLVASRKRAATVFDALARAGVPPERLASVRNPVGLDLGARAAGDVAVSILAEIVAAFARGEPAARSNDASAGDTAPDPVCGMAVEIATARYRAQTADGTYYFCSAGCRGAFAADPAKLAPTHRP